MISKCLMIDIAKRNLLQNPNHTISFKHVTLDQLTSGNNERFDYTVITNVIHKVD